MTRLPRSYVAALVLLASAVALAQEKPADKTAPAADAAPPAGTWKVFLPFLDDGGTGDQPRYLLRFTRKGDGWQGSVVARAEKWPQATIGKVSVTAAVVRFELKMGTLPIACEVKLPKDGKAARVYGSAGIRKKATPLEMEPTKLTSLDEFGLARERFDREPAGHQAIALGLQLLSEAGPNKADARAVRAWAEKVVRSSGLYGTVFQRDMLLAVAATLNQQAAYEKVALEYARRAERALDPREGPGPQKRVLDVLVATLEKNKRDDEVKAVQARLAKLDFRIKPKAFAGRKGKSDRVVLVELFTGAQCPPCVAADLAFDALGKSYKPSEVVLLQYHMHFPGPDPLTSPDGEGRVEFYRRAVRGAPTVLFNGRSAPAGGGDREAAPETYEDYREAVQPLLETDAGASLGLTASRKGPKITIKGEASKLAEIGDDVRFRLALVEEEVNYKGGNGIPVYRQVVRSMPGGVGGIPVKEKAFKKTFTVDTDELRKKLKESLDKYDKEERPFPNKERPLELKKLRVVAFVQNDRTGEVLQAAQVEVKDE